MVESMAEAMDIMEQGVILFYRVVDDHNRARAEYLIEYGNTIDLGKNWSARLDKGLQPNQQDHLHVMLNGNDIAIINKDGSPSHNSNIGDLPRKVRAKVRQLDLVFVENAQFLLETAGHTDSAELQAIIGSFYEIFERRT